MGNNSLEYHPYDFNDQFRGPIANLLHIESDNIQKCKQLPFNGCKLISKNPILFGQQSDTNLKQMIKQRGYSDYFPQDQLMKILQSVVYSLAYLQKKKCVYLDLSPSNIHYIRSKRSYKLASPLTLKSVTYYGPSQLIYSSPQFYEVLNKKSADLDQKSKCDIFSLGLILLQAAVLKPTNLLYSGKNLDLNLLQQRFNQFSKNYNQTVVKYVGLLLQPNSNNRMSAFQYSLFINNQLNIKPLYTKLQNLSQYPTSTYTPVTTTISPTTVISTPNIMQSSTIIQPNISNVYPNNSYQIPTTTTTTSQIMSSKINPQISNYSYRMNYDDRRSGISPNRYSPISPKQNNFQNQSSRVFQEIQRSKRLINQIKKQ